MNLEPLKLKQDVQTKWNSMYIMDRLEKVNVPLSAALSSLPSPPDNVHSEEWNKFHKY